MPTQGPRKPGAKKRPAASRPRGPAKPKGARPSGGPRKAAGARRGPKRRRPTAIEIPYQEPNEKRAREHQPVPAGARVVLATKNAGKVGELAELLEGAPLAALGLEAFKPTGGPREDGVSFAANARKKAIHYSRALRGELVLADDSGLEIDALAGEPGIRSARLGGPHASDADRVRLVLKRMERTPWEKRRARFRCALALGRNGTVLAEFDGVVEGKIAFQPSGSAGFGYDPIFFFEPLNRTFGEMLAIEKNSVSHRHDAMVKAVAWLKERALGPVTR